MVSMYNILGCSCLGPTLTPKMYLKIYVSDNLEFKEIVNTKPLKKTSKSIDY